MKAATLHKSDFVKQNAANHKLADFNTKLTWTKGN